MPAFRFNIVSRSDIERSKGGKIMIQAIESEGNHNRMVIGIPGSGKTTVTIMRAQRLANQGKKILVLTYQTLLRTSLINMADNNLKESIFGFYEWYKQRFGYLYSSDTADDMISKMKNTGTYDEILIDEGQDFEERIFQSLISICRQMTVGADNAQKIHDRGILSAQIQELLINQEEPEMVRLEYNYRNSFEIYNFARYFMPDSERANNYVTLSKMTRGNGILPVVMQVDSDDMTYERLRIILENNSGKNCVILLYHTAEVDNYYNALQKMKFSCSKHYYGNHVNMSIENILVTTYKSAKGLEFQVVIMPDMQTAMDNDKKTAEHYYVGCTRAQESLFLLYKGPSLPNCLMNFPEDSYNHLKLEGPSEANIIDDLPF
jgi:DNA helicase IV